MNFPSLKMRTTAERSSQNDPAIRPIFYQHMAAYEYAAQFCAGKTVLDIGCGEGYGSAVLARNARKVIGVDYSKEAIARCKELYKQSNIEFVCSDIDFFEYGLPIDIVCAFQFIEHLREPRIFLSKVRKLLGRNGIFLLSTPNRIASLVRHPYHFREYSQQELRQLLQQYFDTVEISGLQFSDKVARFRKERREASQKILRLDPLRIHMLLPAVLRRKIFDLVAAVLSNRIHTQHADVISSITTEDYRLTKEVPDTAIDLVALCSNHLA